MTTIVELAEIIDTRLATISGLNHYSHPPGTITPVCAFPTFEDWEMEAMGRGGLKTYRFRLWVLTARSVQPWSGYSTLLEYAASEGDKSIELAIWDGNNKASDGSTASAGSYHGLSGVSMHAASFQALGIEEAAALQVYGGSFQIIARARSN